MTAINKDIVLERVVMRPIEARDNKRMAEILRNSLTEHDAAKPGTAFYDESTDALFQYFNIPKTAYFVAEIDGKVCGGVGIYPTEGLPADVCELVKMYIDKAYRGFGIGKKLISKAEDFARSQKYTQIYLESMPELQNAVKVYEHLEFKHLQAPLGNTGHFSCPIWMLKDL